MNMLENRRSYKESIGEFITAFAEIELYMTLYDAIIKTKNTTNVPLVGSFSTPFKIKMKNVTTFINTNFSENFNKVWNDIKTEINSLYLFRNHIIHGTGFSNFWGEYTKTMIDEEQKREKLSFKSLSIQDIKALSERTYHVLTGDSGIQGFFMQDFLKESSILFSTSIKY
jgi:hypothetical protein